MSDKIGSLPAKESGPIFVSGGLSTVELVADYVAGGWPGTRYEGSKTITMNVGSNEDWSSIQQRAKERIKAHIANMMCMSPGQIELKSLTVGGVPVVGLQ